MHFLRSLDFFFQDGAPTCKTHERRWAYVALDEYWNRFYSSIASVINDQIGLKHIVQDNFLLTSGLTGCPRQFLGETWFLPKITKISIFFINGRGIDFHAHFLL